VGTPVEENRPKIVLIGASAGGIEALIALFAGLTRDFPATTAVVVHRSATRASHLAQVLQRSTGLLIVEPEGPVAIEAGVVFAPRDCHLVMRDHYIEPNRGPKENFSRPAIDPLFRSAALAHGREVIGVVLSGWGSDGVSGLIDIKRSGGVSIAQSPDEAKAPVMPTNAVLRDHVDWILPIAEIRELVLRLVHIPSLGREGVPCPRPRERGPKRRIREASRPPHGRAPLPRQASQPAWL